MAISVILKILLTALGIFALAFISVYLILYFLFYRKNFSRFEKPETIKFEGGNLAQFNDEFEKGATWFLSKNPIKVQIKADDKINLVADFLPFGEPNFSNQEEAFNQAKNANATVILCHGFSGYGIRDFAPVLKDYHEMGFNILIINERAHGESGGKTITFGFKERYDLRNWIYFVNSKLGEKVPILLDGVSMGAATVLMCLGLELPQNVKCAIADCGYTTPYDIIKKVFCSVSHLPEHPNMDIANLMVKINAHFWLKSVSATQAMKTNQVPVFFAHGKSDDFVPYEMTLENYNACLAQKHLLLVENADHCMCILLAHERYIKELKEFAGKFIDF